MNGCACIYGRKKALKTYWLRKSASSFLNGICQKDSEHLSAVAEWVFKIMFSKLGIEINGATDKKEDIVST